MQGKARKILSLVLSFGLIFQQLSFAQVAAELNIAGYLSRINANIIQDKFRPLELRYFSYDSLNDNFKVLLDKGDLKQLDNLKAKEQTKTLLSYFLIGVTLPDDKFWVNLRPDSEDQIIDNYLEKTDVGKIMLEADLQLKKDTASFTSPQTPEGRQYWDRLYKKAAELYGYDNVTIPTLTRSWIVPGEIIIKESKDSAYVYKATLKVMLEQDYLKDSATYNFKDERAKQLNDYSSQLIRELIIPKLTKEVNSSKRYASLRQVYYSLILSRWFKLRFAGKSGSYASLINTRKLTNLTSQEPWSKTDYFKQYQKSFKDGEYNVQEPVYTPTGQVIRSYFSGGEDLTGKTMAIPTVSSPLTNGNIGLFRGSAALPAIPGSIAMEGKGVDPLSVSSPVDSEMDSVNRLVINDANEMVNSGLMTQKDLVSEMTRVFYSAVSQEGKEDSKQKPSNYREFIEQNKIKVALINGKIVGYIMFDSDTSKFSGTLWELRVAKEAQRNKVGTVLMDHTIATLRKVGIIEIHFTVKDGSAGFYQKYFRSDEIHDGGDYIFDPITHEIDDGYDSLNFYDNVGDDTAEEPNSSTSVVHLDENDPVSSKEEIKKLEINNNLWRAHAVLLRNKNSNTGLLILAEPRTGKSNIANQIFTSSSQDWELIANDFLEWTYDERSKSLYAGLRFSNKPSIFWFRDKEGRKRVKPEYVDKREWVKVVKVFCLVKEGQTIENVLKYNQGKGETRKPIAEIPNIMELGLVDGVSVPSELSETYFKEAAEKILSSFPKDITPNEMENAKIEKLNGLYNKIDFHKIAAFLFHHNGNAVLIVLGSGVEKQLLWEDSLKEDVNKLKEWGKNISGLDLESWELSTEVNNPSVVFKGNRALANLSSDENGQDVEIRHFVFAGIHYIGDEKTIIERIKSIKRDGATYEIHDHDVAQIDDYTEQLKSKYFLSSSSPVKEQAIGKTGGIDFRALPMAIQPMGSFSGLNFKFPQLSWAELRQINVDSEMQQIRNMVQAGIMPSGERIKELVAACVQKGEINSHADSLLLCLVDILKMEEQNASESSPELKEALVIVDSQS